MENAYRGRIRIGAAYDRRMDGVEHDHATHDATHDPPNDPAKDPGEQGTLPAGLPSRGAYLLSFGSVVFAGIFGAIIGYGLVNVSSDEATAAEKLLGTIVGSIIAAGGVGIVAVLVLRAMSEWKRRPPPSSPAAPR